MKKFLKISPLIYSALVLLILITDGKTAASGAAEGVKLCIGSVIPSLFPFITFSYILNSALSNISVKKTSPVFRYFGIPKGCESLLFLGLLGGYPVGAQAVNDAYKAKRITKPQGHRLMAFCNNAGPAFIFGVGSCLFYQKWLLWSLWGVHIASALTIALLLPKRKEEAVILPKLSVITLPKALKKAIVTIASVCGWVVLFRTLLALMESYIYPYISDSLRLSLSGGLELTNGFFCLLNGQDIGLRFVFASCFLGFGGVCVLLQTASVTTDLGLGLYFPGKIAQCAISYFLSAGIMSLRFKQIITHPFVTVLFVILLLVCVIFLRKNSSIMDKNAV